MNIRIITTDRDLKRYDRWIRSHVHGSLWQSLEWKTYQESLGREVRIYIEEENKNIVASALVVIDQTIFGLSTWDISKGPLGNGDHSESSIEDVLHVIIKDAKNDRCIGCYFSPPVPFYFHVLCPKSHASPRHEQPQFTRIINVTQSEEEILAQMKQKGRYNIKVAERNDISIAESHDIDAFYTLLKKTGQRNHFQMLSKTHYEKFVRDLPGSFLLLAFEPDKKTPIAGLIGVYWNQKAYYYYGASLYAARAKMAPYLLQWQAIRYCKQRGCATYDLLGIIKSSFSPASTPHPWAGISQFKEQFGGKVVEYPPEQEVVFRSTVKTLLSVKRKFF